MENFFRETRWIGEKKFKQKKELKKKMHSRENELLKTGSEVSTLEK